MFNIPLFLLIGIPLPDFSDPPARRITTLPASDETAVKSSSTGTAVKATPEITPDVCWNCKKANASFAHRMSCSG